MNKKITTIILCGLLGLISCNRDDKVSIQGFTPPSGGSGSSSTPWNHVMTQSIIPNASNVYDIGSADFPVRSIYLGTNTLIIGGAAVSSVDGDISFDGGIRVGNDLTVVGQGFIGVGMTNPASAVTVDGDIWSTNGWVMAHIGFKNSTNTFTFTGGVARVNGSALGADGAGAFGLYANGNILLTNNAITNLSTVANVFITDPTIMLADITNGTFNGSGNYASISKGLTMAGTSNRIVAQNQPVDYASILGGYRNSITDAVASVICGGISNSIKDSTSGSFIGAGVFNTILGPRGVIGGGGGPGIEGNLISSGAGYAFIGGGNYHIIGANSANSTIGGGSGNVISNDSRRSTIAGGYGNTIATLSEYAFIGGGLFNDLGQSSFYSVIGGGYDNNTGAGSTYSAIVGGTANNIGAGSTHSFIGGGNANNVGADGGVAGFVGGGGGNQARLNYDAVVGGFQNYNSCDYGFIGGGYQNLIRYGTSHSSVIGGGYINSITNGCDQAVIGGGNQNIIANDADHSTIPGGSLNQILGADEAFAAGRRASALHNGTYVWSSDANNTGLFSSTSTNQYLIDAPGGVGIGTNAPAAALDVNGDYASRGLVGVTVTQIFLDASSGIRTNIFVGGILISGENF